MFYIKQEYYLFTLGLDLMMIRAVSTQFMGPHFLHNGLILQNICAKYITGPFLHQNLTFQTV